MTTVASLITDLKIATARTDANAEAVMLRGINAGLVAVTLLFKPSVMRSSGNLTAGSGNRYTSLSSLTRWMVIEEVYNSTAGQRVWPLDFRELEVLPIPSGSVLYYGISGNNLFYKPIPSVNETLVAYYLLYPERVTSTDSLPFDENQDTVFSIAQAFTWAAFEESESSSLWQKVADITGLPFAQISQTRDLLMRQPPNVYDIQNAIPKSPTTG